MISLSDEVDDHGFRTPKSLRVIDVKDDEIAGEALSFEDFQAWLLGGQCQAEFFHDSWVQHLTAVSGGKSYTSDERASLFWDEIVNSVPGPHLEERGTES